MSTPPSATQTQPVPASGLDLHVRLGDRVERGQSLFTLHTETTGELAYALEYLETHADVIRIAGESEGDSPSQ